MLAPTAMPGKSQPQDLSGLCILVVDDDASMRSLIRGTLNRCGCQNVLHTGDAREALRQFSVRTIDLVISDWMMEPMSGLDFLRELRRPERAVHVPVIMLTASSEPRDVLLAQPFKISAWLVKPIVPRQLVEQIGAVLTLPDQSLKLDKELGAEVQRLAEQYRAKLANDLLDLEDALAAMQNSKTPASGWAVAADRVSSWAVVDRILHNIKGQAGSFGYGLVTSVAALGQELTRPVRGNVSLIHQHHDELHRCVTALVQAMRLVLQTEIRGDGGQVGERLIAKLHSYTGRVRAKFDATAESS
jgi:two-component system, chemotaxis family, chemotaxis protein CheY